MMFLKATLFLTILVVCHSANNDVKPNDNDNVDENVTKNLNDNVNENIDENINSRINDNSNANTNDNVNVNNVNERVTENINANIKDNDNVNENVKNNENENVNKNFNDIINENVKNNENVNTNSKTNANENVKVNNNVHYNVNGNIDSETSTKISAEFSVNIKQNPILAEIKEAINKVRIAAQKEKVMITSYLSTLESADMAEQRGHEAVHDNMKLIYKTINGTIKKLEKQGIKVDHCIHKAKNELIMNRQRNYIILKRCGTEAQQQYSIFVQDVLETIDYEDLYTLEMNRCLEINNQLCLEELLTDINNYIEVMPSNFNKFFYDIKEILVQIERHMSICIVRVEVESDIEAEDTIKAMTRCIKRSVPEHAMFIRT